jgi:hypothetical protein
MSLAHFQDAMVRLITDPDFRDHIAAGNAATDATLSERETTRLQRIARDPGLGINRTLHKGFRLGKLRGLLPFTCRLLGTRRLCDELARFWRAHPPASFYFLPEAADFCDYLRSRKLRLRYLDDVIAYERATLELERACIGTPPPQHVRFRHDPTALLAALAQGRNPRAIRPRPCIATGTRDADGQTTWILEENAAA